MKRARLRELGITLGVHPTGAHNAITDVPGVKVGHTTLVEGSGALDKGKGPVRTGVTCIVPADDVFTNRLIGGSFVLNGAGEVAGLTQVSEWGLLETPIFLTNTLSVGKVSDAAVKWITRRHPGIGSEEDVIIPVVGECDDSFLNDAVGRHIRSRHVSHAIDSARGGEVAEGSVGAGTGMITCDFKAGIGTSSRVVHDGRFTLGVLVLTNFGVMPGLRIDGVPIGRLLEPAYRDPRRVDNYGSIISVIATDAPLTSSQLGRVCKRAALGIGRVGSYAAHGSGEILLAFSTANRVPRGGPEIVGLTHQVTALYDRAIGPLYEAVIEATEEAIVNALCVAGDMTGQGGNFAPGLPLERVVALMKQYRPAFV